MPAYCRINKIDFKAIKIQETARADSAGGLGDQEGGFHHHVPRVPTMKSPSRPRSKVGVKLSRVFMKDTGLDIYGTSLIVKDEDVKKRPEFVRAYVEATLEGLRYARDQSGRVAQDSAQAQTRARSALTTLQLKNALTEVFLPLESAQVGLGYMKPDIIEKTVKVTNEYFDVGRKVAAKEVYTNQFIRR